MKSVSVRTEFRFIISVGIVFPPGLAFIFVDIPSADDELHIRTTHVFKSLLERANTIWLYSNI